MKHKTIDLRTGQTNGHIITVWNANESTYRPDQVYVTAVLPGARKGPHLHKRRHGMFCCVSGNADIITRDEAGVYVRHCDIGFDHRLVSVPPGMVAEIIWKYRPDSGIKQVAGPALPESNMHLDEPALLINMPTPGWAENDQDEHEVTDWQPNV